ncbi:hypothetical protein Tco_1290451 [Tanacetum coccineum]
MRKAAKKVASYFEGYMPLQKLLLQILHDVVKAAIRLAGSYEGYYIGYREGCHIVGRLLQSLHAVVKVATKVDGCYRGCHIGSRLLRRLQHCQEGCCEGYNGVCWIMQRLPYKFPANVKAATKPYGLCEGCHIDCKLL